MTGRSKIIAYKCPKCGTENIPRGKALTVALTCKACNLYFCPESGAQDTFTEKYEGSFVIGSKATIDGKTYELLGYTRKKERKYRYQWTEYFLFSPYHGIAFLSESEGNWNFLTPYAHHPLSLTNDIDDPEAMGLRFKLYSKYQAEVIFAKGEFFVDMIGVTESNQHIEHIAPPYVLALEKNSNVIGSYLGKYISPKEVAAAFKTDKSKLPIKNGLGYTEPIPGSFPPSALTTVTAVAIALALAITLFFNSMAAEENIMQMSFSKDQLKDSVKMFSTSSFDLPDTKSLVVNVTAPVDNDWFFAEYSLINDNTGDEYVFDNAVEFYHGYDDEGLWSEGKRTAELFLSHVPPGRYHFDIYPEFSGNNSTFRIAVFRDATFVADFWLTAIGLCVFPIIYSFYRHVREMRRWKDSDYSPYDTE